MQCKRNLLVTGVALALHAGLAGADTHIVTSGADDGEGSLRAAIAAASSGDIIEIDPGLNIVLDSPLSNGGKSLIIHADGLDDLGASISPSGTGYRLLELGNPESAADDATELSQIILAGLTLTGAASQAPGGAVYGENVDLTLFESSITGNSGVLAGGGALLRRSAVCLDGATVSDNELQISGYNGDNSDSLYGVGGGLAVEGALVSSKYSGSDSCALNIAQQGVFGLTEAEAEVLFPEADFGYRGSLVSGNSIVMPDDAAGAYLVAAAGGGLAVMGLNSNQAGAGQTALIGVDVLNNSVEVGNAVLDNGSHYTFAAGGGVFVGSTDDAYVVLVGSSISGNDIDLDVANAEGEKYEDQVSTAFGGGLAVLGDRDYANTGPQEGNWLSVFKYAVTNPGFGLPELSAIGGYTADGYIAVNSKYSLIDDNSVEVSVQGVEGSASGYSYTQAFGGGMAVVANDTVGDSSDPYAGAPSVISVFSGVSGNVVDVAFTDVSDQSQIGGGGVAVGRLGLGPSAQGIRLDEGKYVSIFASVVDNSVTLSGVGESFILDGLVGGGGRLATASIHVFDSLYLSEETASEFSSVGGLNPEQAVSLLTRDRGVAGNSVQVQDVVLVNSSVGGGGSMGVNQSHPTGEDSPQIGAGGVVKYGSVTGNTVSVSSSPLINSSVTGGGISAGMLPRGTASYEVPRAAYLSLLAANVSGNSLIVSNDGLGPSYDSGAGTVIVAGAGAHVGDASAFLDELSPELNHFLGVKYSSVSNNALSVSGMVMGEYDADDYWDENFLVTGGSALSGMGGGYVGEAADSLVQMGLFNVTIYGNDHSLTVDDGGGDVLAGGAIVSVNPDLIMAHGTISENTSSVNGSPVGGQFGSLLGSGEVEILNSLLSSSARQDESGDFAFADASAEQLERVSIVGTASSYPYSGLDGFLSADVADPSVLGELSLGYAGLTDEKYGPSLRIEYLPLVQGSAPIDPQAEGGGCATAVTGVFDLDTLLAPRDDCPDLGAYEYGGDRDGDGVSSAEESNGPGTLEVSEPGAGDSDSLQILAGDGNSDGLPDSVQDYVATVQSADGWFTLQGKDLPDEGCTSQLRSVALASSLGFVDTNLGRVDLQLGGVSFTADCVDSDPVSFDLIAPLRGNLSDMSLIKQQCDASSADSGWVVLDGRAEAFGADRVRFSFEIEPNGELDCDDDPTTLTDPGYVVSKARGDGEVVPVPSLSPWMLSVLAGLAALLGGSRARRSRRKR